jgi:RHS repeat-associated protein
MEERYGYDVFGNPYRGDMNNGVRLGYTGNPYNMVSGLYNYGYRDYAPEVARFTSEDPIHLQSAFIDRFPLPLLNFIRAGPGGT